MTTHNGRKYSAARNLRAQLLKPGDLVWDEARKVSDEVTSARKADGWLYARFAGRAGEFLINPTKPLLVWIPEHQPIGGTA